MSFINAFSTRLLSALTAASIIGLSTLSAGANEHGSVFTPNHTTDRWHRLERGEVVVGSHVQGEVKFITGSVLINASPDRVWPIMANPFEFQRKISPRMGDVEIMTDKTNVSVMKVSMDVPVFLPKIIYTAESKYVNNERIDFRRVSGTLRDFKGTWSISPIDGGKKTELTYSMYLDPGFFVPQWVVREGLKSELPRTLELLRSRIMQVCQDDKPLVVHSILAANPERNSVAINRSIVY